MPPPGVEMHDEHMGFDLRVFRKALAERFSSKKASTSPFPVPGTVACPPACFVVEERGQDARRGGTLVSSAGGLARQ